MSTHASSNTRADRAAQSKQTFGTLKTGLTYCTTVVTQNFETVLATKSGQHPQSRELGWLAYVHPITESMKTFSVRA